MEEKNNSLYHSQRIKKPSSRQLIYETNFDEKTEGSIRRKKKKILKKTKKNNKNSNIVSFLAVHIKEKKIKKNLIDSNNLKENYNGKKLSKTGKKIQFLKEKLFKPKNKLKRIFNPEHHEDRKLKKIKIENELKELQEVYGEKLEKKEEPKIKLVHWDFVLKEIIEISEFITQRRKYFIFMGRKLSKLAQLNNKNKTSIVQNKKKEEERSLLKISETCAKMIKKDFWSTLQRMLQYNNQKQSDKQNRLSQQEKLESLVSKQLQLTHKMADSFHNVSTLSENEPDSPIPGIGKKFFIIIQKQENSTYILDSIIRKEEDINEKKQSIETITHEANALQPQGFTLNANPLTITQPFLIKHELREYQLIGMNWLATLNQKNMNGILADEMGLGKTIQTIALLAYLAAEKGIWGPHLIIVPTSILINWEIEFKRWCPAFKIMSYYGSPKERKMKRFGWSRINSFHICITSYKIVIQDQKIFRRKRWYYMILDEAQHIKNFKSQTWQTLLYFHTKNRLLLTGTPLQNDVCELWSLMHFLMPNIFDSHSDFREWFSIPMQLALQKNLPIGNEIISKLHSILRPFLLRRLKKDVEKQLPHKTEYLIKCQLSPRQRLLYDEFINRENRKSRMHSQDFLGLMNVLMQLRKVCNHPDLYEPRLIESPLLIIALHWIVHSNMIGIIDKKTGILINKSGIGIEKFRAPKTENRELVLEIIEKKYNEKIEEKSMAKKWILIEKQERIESVNRNYSLNQKRISDSYCIYSSSLIQSLNFPVPLNPFENEFGNTIEKRLEKNKFTLNEFLFKVKKTIAKPINFYISSYRSTYQYEKDSYQNILPILKNLTNDLHYCKIRGELYFPDKKIAIYDSGKLNSLISLLKKLKSEGHKVIIFTQMSKMLDIFEFALNTYLFTYVRLDGSTRPEMRQKVVERFNNDPKIFCFVSSTRSGGIGLNLTGADTVVFYDTDWNPAMDRQAQDRCHRIGQTKNVRIYRLISEFTIEENILLKSVQKGKLDTFIMEEGKFNTECLIQQKVNVKDLLSNVVKGSLDLDLDDMNYRDYQQTLEQIEDPEDIQAGKKAELEEKNVDLDEIEDFERQEQQEHEDFHIDFNKLPDIYQYGLKILNYENSGLENSLIQIENA